MQYQSGSVVYGRDRERLVRRRNGLVLVLAFALVAAIGARSVTPGVASATPVPSRADPNWGAEVTTLRQQLEVARGELRIASAHLERWNRIFGYAREYKIPSDLAASIYDAALTERIDPELAFPLVRLESDFNERATSTVGAAGLTQLMLSTAREFDRSLTRERLYDRDVNLRIGFRYLRELIAWQRGDVQMALLAYNRGPAAVETAKALDLDASNGYDRIVLRGYRGKGVLD